MMKYLACTLVFLLGCSTINTNVEKIYNNSKYVAEKDKLTAEWVAKKNESCIKLASSDTALVLAKLKKADAINECMEPVFAIANKVSDLVDKIHSLSKDLTLKSLVSTKDFSKIQTLTDEILKNTDELKKVELN